MNAKTHAVCIVVAGVLHFYSQDAVPDAQSNYRTTDRSKATRFTREEALKTQRYLGSAYDIIRLEPYTVDYPVCTDPATCGKPSRCKAHDAYWHGGGPEPLV